MGAAGSHHDALESYQKAVALAPSRLIHRVELGRTLHRLGKKEQARQELEVNFPKSFLLHAYLNFLPENLMRFNPVVQVHTDCKWFTHPAWLV